jgi:hypothetical protein
MADVRQPRDTERELAIVVLAAMCCFLLLHLGFAFVSFARLKLYGQTRFDYIAALVISAGSLLLALRARTLGTLLALSAALAIANLLALDVRPCSQVRWAFVACILMMFYLSLRWWSTRRDRLSASVLILVLLGLLAQLPLVGTELVLRWMARTTDGTKLPCLSYGNTLWKQAELYDGEVNSRGLREREIPQFKPPGEWRCLFDGDSVTFGLGVADAQTLPRQFEDLANQQLAGGGLHYQTINAGWAGWNTDQEFEQLLRLGGFYEPDAVVLVWFPNDIEMQGVRYRMPLLPYIDQLYDNWLAYTYLQILVSNAAVGLGLKQDYISFLHDHFKNDQDYGVMKSYLYNMKVWCHHYHRQFVVVLYPFMEELQHYRMADVHAQLHKTLDEFGVPCCDLLPVFAGRDEKALQVNTRWDHHPNAAADTIAAQALFKFMVENQLIPTAATPPPGNATATPAPSPR